MTLDQLVDHLVGLEVFFLLVQLVNFLYHPLLLNFVVFNCKYFLETLEKKLQVLLVSEPFDPVDHISIVHQKHSRGLRNLQKSRELIARIYVQYCELPLELATSVVVQYLWQKRLTQFAPATQINPTKSHLLRINKKHTRLITFHNVLVKFFQVCNFENLPVSQKKLTVS